MNFLDLGCGAGGSMEYCQKRIGGEGFGIDLNFKQLSIARSRGFNVVQGDATQFDIFSRKFDYISMMDFLEHLPNKDVVHWVLARAMLLGKEFLWIVGPYFEKDDYLNSIGMKFTWSDWRVHTTRVTFDLVEDILLLYGIREYCKFVFRPIKDSSSKFILPISAPVDTIAYDQSIHAEKPKINFDDPLHTQIIVIASLGKMRQNDLRSIAHSAREEINEVS